MRPLHLVWTSLLLLFTFVIQESVISAIHFPIAGYSLYLAVATGIMTLEERTGAIVIGFIDQSAPSITVTSVPVSGNAGSLIVIEPSEVSPMILSLSFAV